MPLSDLLEVLRQDAEARATALVATAREEAERLVAEAEHQLARRLTEAIKVREAELRASAATEIEAARQTATGDVLRARADAVAKVFARASGLLQQRALDPRLEGHWTEAVTDARSYIARGEAVVRRPPDLAGISVQAADGSVAVDGTVGALLTRLEPGLAIEIARELEAGG
jgi:vacuolar-type H+-ATPase subunit E/Vma4